VSSSASSRSMGSSVVRAGANAPTRMTSAGVEVSMLNGVPNVSDFWSGCPSCPRTAVHTASSSMATSRLTDGRVLASSRAPDSHRHRQHGGHRDRDRATVSTRANCSVVRIALPAHQGGDDDDGDQHDRQDDQVVADLEHGALEMADVCASATTTAVLPK